MGAAIFEAEADRGRLAVDHQAHHDRAAFRRSRQDRAGISRVAGIDERTRHAAALNQPLSLEVDRLGDRLACLASRRARSGTRTVRPSQDDCGDCAGPAASSWKGISGRLGKSANVERSAKGASVSAAGGLQIVRCDVKQRRIVAHVTEHDRVDACSLHGSRARPRKRDALHAPGRAAFRRIARSDRRRCERFEDADAPRLRAEGSEPAGRARAPRRHEVWSRASGRGNGAPRSGCARSSGTRHSPARDAQAQASRLRAHRVPPAFEATNTSKPELPLARASIEPVRRPTHSERHRSPTASRPPDRDQSAMRGDPSVNGNCRS